MSFAQLINLGPPNGGEPPLEGYFIAPTGSDTTGDGSEGSPWATMQKFIDAEPDAGSTLYCRGGTYVSPGVTFSGYNGHPALVGTAGSPITLRNYPGETPVFQQTGSTVQIRGDSAYVVLDGLQFTSGPFNQTGVLYVGGNASSYSTHHITIRNCKVTFSGTFPDATGHAVYASAYCSDITVEYNELVGPGAGNLGGYGMHVFHSPGALNVVTRYNIIRNWQDASGGGLVVWDGAATGSILHNTFIDCSNNIYIADYATLTVRDNAGEDAIRGVAYNLLDSQGTATKDHNFWDQEFDANNYLLDGELGRGAASDGTDAGALDW